MRTAIKVNDAQTVHECARHVDCGRELDHRDRPHPRHDQRHAGGPALADVVPVHLPFLCRLLSRVIMLLSLRRQFESGRHEPPRIGSVLVVMHPGSRQVEGRFWARFARFAGVSAPNGAGATRPEPARTAPRPPGLGPSGDNDLYRRSHSVPPFDWQKISHTKQVVRFCTYNHAHGQRSSESACSRRSRECRSKKSTRRKASRTLTEARDLGNPGEPPYTRGIHETMYRGKLWTMRQFSGFGTAEETNKRYRYLLEHGQTGLSVAFHLPTLMGYDSDHPMSAGEVGKCGVAIDSLADMELLFDGIPLDKISTSMTTNAPATILWSMYLVVAEKQGVSVGKASRHDSERHPQGIHRREDLHLSAPAFDEAGRGHAGVRIATRSAMESDFHQRLPHPRSRLDSPAGTGIHALRRH